MSDSFDPYHLWLGIPPEEQPPDHYRLLALRRFESNPVAISNAADRQMAFVKLHASGPHSAVSQKLLNEIAAARLTLLSAAKKAEYDERLRADSPPLPAPPVARPVAPPVASAAASPSEELIFASAPDFDAPPDAASPFEFADTSLPTFKPPLTPTTVVPATSSVVPSFAAPPDFSYPLAPVPPPRTPPRGEPAASPGFDSSKIGLAIGIAVALAYVILNVFDWNDDGSNIRIATDPAAPPWSAPLPPTPYTPRAEPEEAPRPRPDPPLEYMEGPNSGMPGSASGGANSRPYPADKKALPDLAGAVGPGEWVDLLAMLDGFDWRRHGVDWAQHIDGRANQYGVTVRPPVNLGRVPLPVFLHGDYELECDLQLVQGEKNFGLVFPVGVNNVALDLHAQHDAFTTDGLDTIDGIWSYDVANPTTHSPTRIQDHEKHRITIRVEQAAERAKIVVGLDDDPRYIEWEGRQEQLAFSRAWDPMCVGRPWLAVWEGVLRCETMRLRMLSGVMRRDSYTYADRQQDLANGFIRLVGEPRRNVSSGWASVVVNQLPPEYEVEQVYRAWPLVSADFKYCDDYYPAPSSSRLEAPIPAGAKSFSVVAYNDCSRTSTFEIEVDGQRVYHTPRGGVVLIKVDLPPNAANLALIAGEFENANGDHVSWCYPRYHSVTAKEIADASIDGPPGDLPFRLPPITGGLGGLGAPRFTHFTRGGDSILGPPAPLAYRSATVCDEFIFAHGASSITFDVPPGMTRFTAVGYNALSRDAEFVLTAPHSQIYSSGKAGIVAINAELPSDLTTLTLEVRDRGNNDADQAMWCYPRLHRQ